MNRNHLALFHAVVQAGSISGGAHAVRISQPAVSKQVAELEGALGLKLLERLPRGCRPTEAGAILAGYAGRLKALEEDVARVIQEYRGLKRGRLSIGASLTVAGYLLPKVLTEFHRQFPEIEMQVHTANTERIQTALRDGVIELGLTEGPQESAELETREFFEDELVAIAPAGHPLLVRSKVTARELCREPLLVREIGSGTRAVVERAFRRKGLTLKPLLSMGSPEAIKNLVACGMGVAVVSRLIVGRELESGLIGIVQLKDLKIRRPLHLQRLRGRTPSPIGLKFLEVLSEATKTAPVAADKTINSRQR